MQSRTRHITFFCFTMLHLLYCGSWAQNDTDSILYFATQQIHESPNIAISTAEKLLTNKNITPDIKARAYLIISTAYSSKRGYEKSMEYALSAMDLLPQIKNGNIKINVLNRIGGIYQELQLYEKAILYLDKALESINNLPESEAKTRNLGVNNLLRGFIYREHMSCDIALDYFEKGIDYYKEIPNTIGGNANISNAYYNIGNCFIELDRINEAENSFLESITYAQKADAISSIAFAQKGLSQVYTLQKHYTKAINLLTKALHTSENVGDKVLNRSLYDALASNYLALGDLENYSLYKSKNISVNFEIIKTERKTVDDSISDLMETNSQKIEKLQNRTKTVMIILSILILLALIFMFRNIFNSNRKLKTLKKRLKF